MMFTTRFWGSAAVLLCALLLQSCQSNPLRAAEEEALTASSSATSAMHRRALSEPLAVRSLAPLSTSLAALVSPSRFSKTQAHKEDRAAVLSSRPLSLFAPSTLATVSTPPKDSKPSAKRRSTDLDDELAKRNKQVHAEERGECTCMLRDTLNILLAMAGLEPNKAVQFLDVLLVAAQDKAFRQQALESLGKVAKASPNMFSACLPSLRAAAKEGDRDVRLLALKTLGEVEWKHYFGEVGSAPDLPRDMATILDSACPFWPDKKVRDTHLLVLIPATVDEAPFTLNLLEELIQHPKPGGGKTRYRYYNGTVKAQIGAAPPTASYWLLMTYDVLPESRGKTYAHQKKLVADHARRTSLPYELPKALEAVTVILTRHVRGGEQWYSKSNHSWTYTRCQGLIYSEYPAVVGGFGSSGLSVDGLSCDCNHGSLGVAGCRRF
jgi:hypothetical protein